jgi:hypothetical protein
VNFGHPDVVGGVFLRFHHTAPRQAGPRESLLSDTATQNLIYLLLKY